jgi:lipopolysaccharide transport system ATP-binding protein
LQMSSRMGDDIVIRVEGLGKKYLIGHEAERERYVALRDVITRTAKNAWRKVTDTVRTREIVAGNAVEEFWALKDVSFEIRRGEVLGVIGRNGAGKSTLLKILSRITEPSEGRVTINGRVASLLEVGTGFHPELTGRENIYLNGAILGMTRVEIKRKFDEIVAFAEVEKFLDTPVKRYSSGMYVRLAFAVAAHLEPEILVVDEVLAVGDAEFQKKCLGKMGEVARGGRTILFVSHNMPTVRHLCSRAILLAGGGHKTYEGSSEGAIIRYIQSARSGKALEDIQRLIEQFPSDPSFRLDGVDVVQDGMSTVDIVNDKPVEVVVEYTVLEEVTGLHVYFLLYDLEGNLLVESLHNGHESGPPIMPVGRYISRGTIPANFLAGRPYELEINAAIHRVRECIPQPTPISFRLNVTATGAVYSAYPAYASPAKIAPLLQWRTERL